MRRTGIHTTRQLHLKTATVIVAVVFSLHGLGVVSFFGVMPEIKSGTALLKSPVTKAQFQTKKIHKLVALDDNATYADAVVSVSSSVSRRSFSILLPFQATVPTRGPPVAIPA
jgi:hypothetical protein